MAKKLLQKIFRNKLIVFESVAIIFLLISSSIVFALNTQAFSKEDIKLLFTNGTPTKNTLVRNICYISGQVNKPGVYEFDEDTRLAELIELAGGFTDKADLEFINKNANLSEKLKDEYFIYIPSVDEQKSPTQKTNQASTGQLININTATESQLDSLPGVGPSTAQKIISGRPYTKIEDLLDVEGIGDSKFNDIKNLIGI